MKFFTLMSPEAPASADPKFGFQFNDGPDDFEFESPAPMMDPDEDTVDFFGDDETDTSTGEGANTLESDDATANPSPDSKTPEAFKPYVFKGKVDGQEASQEFKTQRELDNTIANGLLAPKLYEAFTAAKKKISELSTDAEWAKNLVEMSKASPNDFFEHVVEHLLAPEVVAEWVFNKHQEYVKFNQMTPEQRQQHQAIKTAERIMKEQAYNAELAAEAKERELAANLAEQQAQLETWGQRELRIWDAKVPDQYKGLISKYIRAAVLEMRESNKLGEKDVFKQMSRIVSDYLSPFSNGPTTQNPSALKQEELRNNQQRNADAKKGLRELSKQTDSAPPTKKLSGDKLWKAAWAHAMGNK